MDRREAITYRLRVLAVVNSTPGWLTGQAIAQRSGLTYKQTVDALNALNNAAKVARIGRKFTSKWGRVVPEPNPARDLEQAFKGFFR